MFPRYGEIPGRASFAIYPGSRLNTFKLRAVFIDRCRLEITLNEDLAIETEEPFKFMDSMGCTHELSFQSQVLDTIPGIEDYMNEAIAYLQSEHESSKKDMFDEVDSTASREISRIRALMTIHTRQVRE